MADTRSVAQDQGKGTATQSDDVRYGIVSDHGVYGDEGLWYVYEYTRVDGSGAWVRTKKMSTSASWLGAVRDVKAIEASGADDTLDSHYSSLERLEDK